MGGGSREAGMSSVFSEYVCSLGPGGEPPAPEAFDELLETLRPALVHELKRRSLWSAPPSYLGLLGGGRWTEGDVLEELLLECYESIFIRRLRGLKKQLLVRPNIDGLVFLNIRNFLHDAQKRHDPLGFRIFEVLHGAVRRLLQARVLHRLGGDSRVRNDTVLAFTPWGDPQAAQGVELRPVVEVWNSELLPDLITAWSKDEVVGRLERLITRLPDEGVEAFQFGGLIEPMKNDVRARWHAVYLDVEEAAALGWNGGLFEDRQSFRALLECVAEKLDYFEGRKKTREYLGRLWLFFRDRAAEPGADAAGGDGMVVSPDLGERAPSDKQLSELLGIPRGGIRKLRATLGRMVEVCQDEILGKKGVIKTSEGVHSGIPSFPQPSYASDEGPPAMDLKRRREQLRLGTGEAAARLAADDAALVDRGERPPQPGETFVFAGTGAAPVEWLFLERHAADPRRALVVPVDDNPLVGNRDVALSAAEAGGCVARVRCGCGAWLDVEALEAALRTGVLLPEAVERARRRLSEIAGESLRPSTSALEVDGDPEYRSWIETLREARRVLPGDPRPAHPEVSRKQKPSTVVPHPRFRRWRDPRMGYALAASLAAVAVGLSLWVGQLRRELSTPWVFPTSETPEIVVRESERPVELLSLKVTETHVLVYLLLYDVPEHPTVRLELLESDKKGVIWESTAIPREAELLLALPRRLLTSGVYWLRIHGRDEAGREQLLDEREVRIDLRSREE